MLWSLLDCYMFLYISHLSLLMIPTSMCVLYWYYTYYVFFYRYQYDCRLIKVFVVHRWSFFTGFYYFTHTWRLCHDISSLCLDLLHLFCNDPPSHFLYLCFFFTFRVIFLFWNFWSWEMSLRTKPYVNSLGFYFW